MFTGFALVCGLINGPAELLEDGCFKFTNNTEFKSEAECVEKLRTEGLPALHYILTQKHMEPDPQLVEYGCEQAEVDA